MFYNWNTLPFEWQVQFGRSANFLMKQNEWCFIFIFDTPTDDPPNYAANFLLLLFHFEGAWLITIMWFNYKPTIWISSATALGKSRLSLILGDWHAMITTVWAALCCYYLLGNLGPHKQHPNLRGSKGDVNLLRLFDTLDTFPWHFSGHKELSL